MDGSIDELSNIFFNLFRYNTVINLKKKLADQLINLHGGK